MASTTETLSLVSQMMGREKKRISGIEQFYHILPLNETSAVLKISDGFVIITSI